MVDWGNTVTKLWGDRPALLLASSSMSDFSDVTSNLAKLDAAKPVTLQPRSDVNSSSPTKNGDEKRNCLVNEKRSTCII